MKSYRKLCIPILVLVLALFLQGGVCAQEAPQWHKQTVDNKPRERPGGSTSLVLDLAGRPHISYWSYRGNRSDLRYAHYDGISWQIETVDSRSGISFDTSLALDSLGRPHIAFYAQGLDHGLKYASYDGATWAIETVDGEERVGLRPSLVLDAGDRPHIAYYADLLYDLRYAYYDGTTWYTETVDSEGDVGPPPSMALDSAGRPHIGYIDGNDLSLKYAHHDGTAWRFERAAAEAVGCVSLALDAANRPHMCYCGTAAATDLRYAYHDGSSWHTETVDAGKDVGAWPSLALDAAGWPHISYFDGENADLKYAYRGGTALGQGSGSAWQVETVDSAGRVGTDTSLALDMAGQPHITYQDITNSALKYAYRSTGVLLPGTGGPSPIVPAGIVAAILIALGILARHGVQKRID